MLKQKHQGEEQRLENQHQILQYLFEGRLFFPPIQHPKKVLDCGYGRGNWALEMAQTYPDSEVGPSLLDLLPTRIRDGREGTEEETNMQIFYPSKPRKSCGSEILLLARRQ